MDITEIRMFLCNEPRLKATLSVTFDDVFVVKGVKVIEGKHGLFVAMPSRKAESSFEDICHPVNRTFREHLENTVMREYSRLTGIPFDEIEAMMRDSQASRRARTSDGEPSSPGESLSRASDRTESSDQGSEESAAESPRPSRPRRPKYPEDGDETVPSQL